MAGTIVAGAGTRSLPACRLTRGRCAGELYIGIRGERSTVRIAQSAIGAAPLGSSFRVGGPRLAGETQAVVIEVDDTTSALQALAHAVRIDSGTKVCITGSAGKTTKRK